MTRLILAELAASATLIALIHAVLRHACDPRRDGGRHRPGRHALIGGVR